MKRRKLRCWVKIVIFAIGVIAGICLANAIVKEAAKQKEFEKQAINYCIAQGKTEKKCIEGLYGN